MNETTSVSTLDLSELSIRELEALAEQVTRAISERRKTRSKELLAALAQEAEAEGLSLEEVIGQSTRRRKNDPVVRYQNPNDPDETWSGRGPRPRWVKEALANGAPLESLAVNLRDNRVEERES